MAGSVYLGTAGSGNHKDDHVCTRRNRRQYKELLDGGTGASHQRNPAGIGGICDAASGVYYRISGH